MPAILTWPLDARSGALAMLGVVLVLASLTDLKTGRIPNVLTYPAFLAALAWQAAMGGQSGALGLGGALLGVAVGFVPLLVAWKAGGIGGGDAKLMAVVGALGGWQFAVAVLFFGFAVAAVMAIVVMIRKRVVKQTLGRIGRFLWLAAGGVKPGDPATAASPVIPFGLALCIGAAVVLADELLGGTIAGAVFLSH